MHTLRIAYYMLLISFKDFGYWFWTLCYPLLMATLFMLTASSIDSAEIQDIEVGVEDGHPYIEAFNSIDFMNVHETTENEGLDMLNDDEITGFITADQNLIVNESGFEETVLESVLNQMTQMTTSGIPFENFDFTQSFTAQTDLNSDPATIMFYSLIAMTTFYSMFSSIDLISSVQPNLSNHGARFNATPFSKFKFLFANSIGALLLGLFSNILVIVYLMIFNDTTLFENFGRTFLLILVANISAIGIGFAIGLIPKLSVNFKTVTAVITVIFLAFLSGMAGPDLKNLLDEHVPILNTLNPVARVTDTMLRINILNNYSDYWTTILYLAGIGLFFFLLSLIALRRKQYDSI
ncbi:ABC transporter permease [Corticicoccus populi]|uniref:ABC transporter permease n=1 Tax=Corticicoccus populi TaxID=1812821 RepID=A0ABW5WXJ5_9STAP